FALVLAWWVVHERTRGGIALLALFVAICGFAYPLALPVVLIPLVVLLWPERRGLWRKMYRGHKSLVWMLPLAAILFIPIAGVIEKAASAVTIVVDPGYDLSAWGGDLRGYFEEQQFFGIEPLWLFL